MLRYWIIRMKVKSLKLNELKLNVKILDYKKERTIIKAKC